MLGNQQAMTLSYVVNIGLDPAAGGVPVTNVFSVNSLFDPDRTGAGHQPRGFDQISLLFSKYIVVGAKISATYISTNVADSSYIIGITTLNTVSTATLQHTLLESRNSNYRGMGVLQPQMTITKRFSARKWFRVPHPLSDATLTGTLLPQA